MSEYDMNLPPENRPGQSGEDNPKEPIQEQTDRPDDTGDETRVFNSTARAPKPIFRLFNRARNAVYESGRVLLGDEKPGSDKIIRKKSRRWGCLGAALYFLLVVSTSALLAVVGWQAAVDVLGLSDEDVQTQVTIDKSDTLLDVVQKLKDAGMIRYKSLFKLYAEYSNAMEKIDPGTYILSTSYDYRALVSNMTQYRPLSDVVEVTIPEGYNVEQIFDLLENKGVCLRSDLETIAADYDFKYDFLADIELGDFNRLEGYLFPDTYEFYVGADPVNAIDKLLSNFDKKLTDELLQVIEGSGYSLRDIIIIASMIEKEAYVGKDRELISSVIYNRLGIGMKLQIDATVLYALGVHKDIVTLEDLEVDSPYNTYKYEGLPLGPIANPGINSIKAALMPAQSDYFYYVLKSDGSHYFCQTHEQQQAFIASQQQE